MADLLHIPEQSSLVEMVSAAHDVPICNKLDKERCEENRRFLASCKGTKYQKVRPNDLRTMIARDFEDETAEDIPPPTLKNLREVVTTLGDVHHY